MVISLSLLQMLTINLEESDCFAAWISVTDVPGLEPRVVDGKGMYGWAMNLPNVLLYTETFVENVCPVWMDGWIIFI